MTMLTLNAEAWLVKRLGEHGAKVFDGDTTPEIRRQRIREVIIEQQLPSVVIGRSAGRPETYRQVFERIYGIKLDDVPRGTSKVSAP
jgi:hypothetical protein